jgi:hypothetical protein
MKMIRNGYLFLILAMLALDAYSSPAVQFVTATSEGAVVDRLEVPALKDRVMDLATVLKPTEAADLKA